MKKDINYIQALEKAVREKYGDIATMNPKHFWNDQKEKEYIQENKRANIHPKLDKIYSKFPKTLNELKNVIFYGPSGTGKYTQMLHLIKKYSPTELKYEKKISVNFNKQSYFFKISDIHYEVDMSLLGCNSKLLWHEIYQQIIDIISAKADKSGIIVCKYFHEIHSELLENFYSYMQLNSAIPVDFETAGEITDDWLFDNMISKIPKDVNLWCFLDCCHSGTAVDLKHNYQSNCKYRKSSSYENVVYKKEEWTDSFNYSIERSKDVVGNVYLFSGCQDKETSADATINNSGQGAFTYCLLETLKTNLQENTQRFKNGTLKLRNILKEINCRLDINGFEQNTQLSLSKKENFESTLNL